jgi:hypothetical protein
MIPPCTLHHTQTQAPLERAHMLDFRPQLLGRVREPIAGIGDRQRPAPASDVGEEHLLTPRSVARFALRAFRDRIPRWWGDV